MMILFIHHRNIHPHSLHHHQIKVSLSRMWNKNKNSNKVPKKQYNTMGTLISSVYIYNPRPN